MKSNVPKNLSKEAKAWWSKILNDYEIEDEAGLLILQTSLEAFDRMRQAQEIIKKEGMQVTDRFDQTKAHPLCVVERDARSQFLQGLKQLNLDLEPLRETPGRPGGK